MTIGKNLACLPFREVEMTYKFGQFNARSNDKNLLTGIISSHAIILQPLLEIRLLMQWNIAIYCPGNFQCDSEELKLTQAGHFHYHLEQISVLCA